MALTSSYYRIKIDVTYGTQNAANNAAAAINTALADAGRVETVTQNSTNVFVMISGLGEAEAVALRASLLSAWSAYSRNFGKVSIVRTNDLD